MKAQKNPLVFLSDIGIIGLGFRASGGMENPSPEKYCCCSRENLAVTSPRKSSNPFLEHSRREKEGIRFSPKHKHAIWYGEYWWNPNHILQQKKKTLTILEREREKNRENSGISNLGIWEREWESRWDVWCHLYTKLCTIVFYKTATRPNKLISFFFLFYPKSDFYHFFSF